MDFSNNSAPIFFPPWAPQAGAMRWSVSLGQGLDSKLLRRVFEAAKEQLCGMAEAWAPRAGGRGMFFGGTSWNFFQNLKL